MNLLKVVTHDNTFHADDVIAVALLQAAGYATQVTRTREPGILAAAIADPSVAVLDVGGQYSPMMFNFDHHQDASLQSAAGLIWENFKNQICEKEAQPFFGAFIASIDAMDTNRDNIYEQWDALPKGFRNTSGIIGGFNRVVTDREDQDFAFSDAVFFARIVIKNELYHAGEKAKAEAVYNHRDILHNNIAVFDEYSAVWKEKGEHVMAVMPHATGWQIISRNSAKAIVPESVKEIPGFKFRHVTGFMAVLETKDSAVAYASTL